MLVTGATGLLGRPLVRELAARGFAVFSVSSKPWEKLHHKVQQLFSDNNVHHVPLDLSKDIQLSKCAGLRRVISEGGFDLVINLAADRGGVKYDGQVMTMNNVVVNAMLPWHLAEITSDEEVLAETAAAMGGREVTKLPMFQVSSEYVWNGEGNTPRGYPAVKVPANLTSSASSPPGQGAGPDCMDVREYFVKEDGTSYAVQKRQSEQNVADYPNVHVIRVPVLYGQMLNALEDGTAGASIDNFLGPNTWKHDTWQKRYPTDADDCAFVMAALALKCCVCGLDQPVYHYGAQESVSKYAFMRFFTEAAGLDENEIQACDMQEIRAAAGKAPPPFDVKLNIDATRDELLRFTGDDRPRNWREPREVDVLTLFKYWLCHFKDVVRARRPEGYTPSSDIVERLSHALRQRLSCPIIVIVGGQEFRSKDSEAIVQEIAKKITGAFRDIPATFVIGGLQGVQATFANCLGDAMKQDRLVNLLSVSCTSAIDVGEDHTVGFTLQERMQVTGMVGDIYLTVEGGPGVASEATAALNRGAAVVPVMRTGGASAGGFGFPVAALEQPAAATKEQWALLQQTDADISHSASAVASILAGLAAGSSCRSAAKAIALFRRFDPDGSGRMPTESLIKVLNTLMPHLRVEDLERLVHAAEPDPTPVCTVSYEKMIRWLFDGE